MKAIFFTIFVLFSFKILADENPEEFCDDNNNCTIKMRELTEKFKKGGDLFTKGSFFFCFDQDPFLGMNSSEIKNWYDERYATATKTEVKSNQVELQYLGPGSDYHYWFRSNQANDKVIMIARQQTDNYLGLIFCELKKK